MAADSLEWNRSRDGCYANLPILLIRDDKVEIGIFDKVISEYKIKSLSSATPLAEIEQNEEFNKWLDLFKNVPLKQ